MENRTMRSWHWINFFFTLAAGTLLHFLYGWTGGAAASLFGSVNESVWEHLKLIFWPALLCTAVEYGVYGYDRKNFIAARTAGILAALLFVPLVFYAYTSFTGRPIPAADICLFVLGCALLYFLSFRLMEAGKLRSTAAAAAAVLCLTALTLAFIGFTFAPPRRELFRDPQTGAYGLALPE